MNANLFCKGYTWGWCGKEGEYQSPEAEKSMELLAKTGIDWICIAVTAWQQTASDVNIFSLFGASQSDTDIIHAIKKAKSLGLKVCLKPCVNCLDGTWRANIHFDEDTENNWDKWFASYTRMMVHYAKLAQEQNCEMLCTGCEMQSMDSHDDHCRKMIEKVRSVYTGIIMHNINHGSELSFSWLDCVDIIGISGYYAVTDGITTDIKTMRMGWQQVIKTLETCHQKYNKPLMFAEIGIRSEHGCSKNPWDPGDGTIKPFDEIEQTDYYQSALEATWDLDYFCGYFWWDWRATLHSLDEAKENRDYGIYGKLAEHILRKWYTEK